jgi:hypothetical protein
MRFLNIAIILRILLGFFQVFYAIFRDFLGFWDLVRFLDFSKDFFGFLMKCTKIFRVIYPSSKIMQRVEFETVFRGGKHSCNYLEYADI